MTSTFCRIFLCNQELALRAIGIAAELAWSDPEFQIDGDGRRVVREETLVW